MSENSLVEKIKADTDALVAEIQATNKKEVSVIEQETAHKLVVLTEAHNVAIKKQHDQLELVAVSRARQKGRISVQQAKRDQIDEIFNEVEAELIAQPADSYVAYFTKMVTETMPSGVVVTAIQAPVGREDETKQILNKREISAPVTTNPEIKAGIVIETTEGVYDVTLARLMKEKRAELEMEVVKKVME